ncbi:MAG TPA: T9SS type A sorting domain-containing protein [Saprospiraceae bacterium]|nr:T9SS type A sorting domain-containing protein [Saprospiraceae bacterium]
MNKSSFLLKIYILALILCSSMFVSSHLYSQTYSFSTSNAPYVPITNATSAVKGSWDDPGLAISIGFGFEYFGETSSVIYSLDDFVGGFFATNLNIEELNLLVPFGVDLIDRGFEIDSALSPIYYKTEGPVGNRVFTLEYNNSGFYSSPIDSVNHIYVDYINFQMRLFEQSGDIEVHIGPHSIADPELVFDAPGPAMGLIEGYDYYEGTVSGEVLLLSGNALTPELITSFEESYVTWPIPENTVYHFTNNTTAVTNINEKIQTSYYFPNPTYQYVTLRPEYLEEILSPVFVSNTLGKLISIDSDPVIIELNNLPAGMYTLHFETSKGWVFQKILIIK